MNRIVSSPTLIYAMTWLEGGETVCYVYRSVLVKSRHALMAPVLDYLDQVCHSPGKGVIVDDANMAFGKAEKAHHRVFDICPGDDVSHRCAQQLEGMVA